MTKKRKSKILATALCTAVMAGIYAAPVMAADTGLVVSTTGGNKIYDHKSEIITIKGVTFEAGGVLTAGAGTFNTLSVAGNRFAVGPNGGIKAADGRFRVDANGNIIVKGALGDSEMFRVDAATGDVTAAGALNADTLTTTGKATVDSLEVAGGKVQVTDTGKFTAGNGAFTVGTAGKTTINNDLNVTGKATVGGKLVVNGETTLTGKLSGQEATFTTVNANNFNGVTLANEADGVKVGGINVTAMDDRTAGLERKVHGAYESTYLEGAVRVNNNLGLQVLDNTNNVVASISRDGAVNAATLTTTGDATVGGNAEVKGTLSAADGKFFVGEFGGINAANGNFKVNKDGDVEAKGTLSAADGKFVVGEFGGINAANGNFKVNKDGVVNADSLKLATAGDIEIGAAVKSLIDADLPDKVEGITRPEEGKTVVEGGAEFTENGMTMGNTVVEDGKITVGAEGDQTIIKGGAITAKSLELDGKDVGATIAGIEREGDVTTIEGVTSFDSNGMNIKDDAGFGTSLDQTGMSITANGGSIDLSTKLTAGFASFSNGGEYDTIINGGRIETGSLKIGGVEFSEWKNEVDGRLDDLEYKTQNIKPGTGAGTGTGAGGASGLTGGEDTITVPDTAPGHTGITGDVTVGGEINAGEIVVGDKGSDNKTTIDGNGINTGNGNFKGQVTVGENTTITGEGITTGTGTFDDVTIGGNTTIDDEGIDTNYINADKGNIGNVEMDNNGITVGGGTTITEDTVTTDNIKADDGEFDSQVTVGDNTTITDGNINLGGDNGTNINADGMIVGNANGVNTNVSAGDVVITDKDGKDIALSDVGYVENIDRELQANGNYDGTVVGGINAEADIRRAEVNRLDNRIDKVEDRVDKVGAMAAAIANLRTMGYDPAAPTEIAVGIGQYRSETGAALGLFHYPNKDFMLSLSVSTSGDEVMGGIGATWKFGRKSPEKMLAAEKEKAVKAKLAKAEAMKKAAVEAKVAAQQARHAQMAAEKAAK